MRVYLDVGAVCRQLVEYATNDKGSELHCQKPADGQQHPHHQEARGGRPEEQGDDEGGWEPNKQARGKAGPKLSPWIARRLVDRVLPRVDEATVCAQSELCVRDIHVKSDQRDKLTDAHAH